VSAAAQSISLSPLLVIIGSSMRFGTNAAREPSLVAQWRIRDGHCRGSNGSDTRQWPPFRTSPFGLVRLSMLLVCGKPPVRQAPLAADT
jgi:hypothetical protein